MPLAPDVVHEMEAGLYRVLVREVAKWPTSLPTMTVTEWAEAKRIIPVGLSPQPGRFRWSVTPYLREIAECLSIGSPVRRVAVMKGARVGATVGILENALGYWIDVAPGPIFFFGADKESAQAVGELRIDPMLQLSGLSEKIYAPVQKAHRKKTGDTKARKDFAGGYLMLLGPNVPAKLRSHPARYLLFDEVDAYPQEAGSEGDPITLAERRSDEFEQIRRILYLSTPGIDQTSRIKKLFEAGDQRRYYVPCPRCGVMQVLRFDQLKYEQDEMGRLVEESVRYECEKCGEPWKNAEKAVFLEAGEWRPTATPIDPTMRSYHLSSLYSPVGFRSWTEVCREWIGAQHEPLRVKAFKTTVLGETWIEKGEAPRFEFVMLRREGYHAEQLEFDDKGLIARVVPAPWPERARLVTVGADVQKDRVECEVVAWGKDGESWSLGYHVLPGQVEIAGAVCWENLARVLLALRGERPQVRVLCAFIDSGYQTATVQRFCGRFPGSVLPIRGDSRVGHRGRVFEIAKAQGAEKPVVSLYTDALKQQLYGYLALGTTEGATTFPPGYCHFPIEYGQRYFEQLTADERMRKRTPSGAVTYLWHCPEGKRNEAHDCRIYAMGALYLVAWDWCEKRPHNDGRIDWQAFWERADRDWARVARE